MSLGGARGGFAVALVLALSPVSVAAQTGTSAVEPTVSGPAQPTVFKSPIVTLDKERMFDDSQMGKAMQARFDAASGDLVAENRRLEAALEEEERSLTERRKTLDPNEFRALSAEFDTRVEELRKAQDAKSRALTRSHEVEQQRLFEATVPVLAQVMVEIDAVAIIDRAAIILSFDQLDITDLAITRLDAALGDGSAPLPPDEAAPNPAQP